MINNKRVLGIITARGGSKGLPGKNLRPLCGKPLIGWTIDKARRSRYLDEVMVTTDSAEIAAVARQFGAAVPFMRPPELSSDRATSFDTVVHTLDFYRREQGREFDYVVLLEPTSPLREDDDVDNMLAALEARADAYDSIVPIGEVGTHPSIMKRWENGNLAPFCPELAQTSRRQDNLPAYFPYGVAYVVKTRTLLEEKSFYSRRGLGYPIKRYQCYEIDDIYDFVCVESVMKHEWNL